MCNNGCSLYLGKVLRIKPVQHAGEHGNSMKLSTLPAAIKAWITPRLPALTFETYEPRKGQVGVLIPPPARLGYQRDGGTVIGTCQQELMAQVRLTTEEYQNLDMALVGGVYQGIALELALRGRRIASDVLSLDLVPVDNPVSIAPSDDQQGGTVVTFRWVFNLTFYADPESPFGLLLGGPFFDPSEGLYTAENIQWSLYKTPLSSEVLTDGAIRDSGNE